MIKVLLLGGGLQALCCGKSLNDLHYHVDAVTDDLQIIKSKFFRRVYSDIDSASEQVYSILEKEKYNVLIPMVDKNVSFLSENKLFIEDKFGCRCACVGYDVLKIVEDKHLFMEFCQCNGIPHPETCVISEDCCAEAADKVGFPALIKPDFSIGARGITLVNSAEELKEKFSKIKAVYGECTLQEYIDNKEYYYNVMLYRNAEGQFLAYTIIKIVRMYPINAGSSTCCISVEDRELLQICKDCLDKLNWVGMADFDVLQRPDNKEFKIIEINARVPASLKGSLASGVNFSEVITKDIMAEPVPEYNYQTGKILRYLGTDILWFLKSKNRFKAAPSWFYFFGNSISYQDIYKDDFTTWWTWLAGGLKKFGKRNKRLR